MKTTRRSISSTCFLSNREIPLVPKVSEALWERTLAAETPFPFHRLAIHQQSFAKQRRAAHRQVHRLDQSRRILLSHILPHRLDDEVGKAGTKTQGAAREKSSTPQAARKPAPASGGGALAEAMRRASEKSGRGK